MPTPAYMTLKDDQGNFITGSVQIAGREGQVEVMEMHHDIRIPTDAHTGQLRGVRMHNPVRIIKQFDSASPYLYKACCEGQTYASVQIDWYRIDDTGTEVIYFTHTLEQVKISSVRAYMPNSKEPSKEALPHLEEVAFVYGKITWGYTDGNLEYTDAWTGAR